jgi:hypothetical protein
VDENYDIHQVALHQYRAMAGGFAPKIHKQKQSGRESRAILLRPPCPSVVENTIFIPDHHQKIHDLNNKSDNKGCTVAGRVSLKVVCRIAWCERFCGGCE